MATLSVRIRDDLKQKVQELAASQGVSLNNFINASVAAAVAQNETLTFFGDPLRDVDLEALHDRVVATMRQTKPGDGLTAEELRQALGGD